MAIYRLWSGATGAGTGADWDNAFTTLAAALAAATASGDVITPHVTHLETLAATTTFTAPTNISIIVLDKDNVLAIPKMDGATGGIINNSPINFEGAFRVYMRGMAVKSTGLGGSMLIAIARSDGAHFELENCLLWLSATGSSGSFSVGYDAGARNGYVKLKNTELRNANSAFKLAIFCRFEMEGGSCNFVTGTQLISQINNGAVTPVFTGVDLTSAAMTLLGDQTANARSAVFNNCALHASTVPLATQTLTNNSAGEVFLNDCTKGGARITGHYNALGSTEISTSVYTNDAYTFDDANQSSWKITTTANASFLAPYVSPWMDQFHGGSTAITPYLEVVRDGSATALQDDEAWAEFGYLAASGSTLMSFASGRMLDLGTPANHDASSKTAADWTGESATAWFGKLDSGAVITPAEKGSLRARVCVAAANETLYVDTQIRGVA